MEEPSDLFLSRGSRTPRLVGAKISDNSLQGEKFEGWERAQPLQALACRTFEIF